MRGSQPSLPAVGRPSTLPSSSSSSQNRRRCKSSELNQAKSSRELNQPSRFSKSISLSIEPLKPCPFVPSLGVSDVTLRFSGVTASVVGANSPLFGWIRLDVELNKNFSYSSGKGFSTTGPQTETGNVVTYM
ncbi:hypothetical protein E5676_scaffold242G00130 [Cucumis melo var. makuwa]|uniref:Uncharacterized protein n=1 Tax=Cucumis melo var. makuwa TaxID=1194695 RepID=A0A5A7TJ37_CUCMM|nr:hypothetical protein E6C27_scaffold93G001060 [Cucumis melo var. makuwa]TYK19627.1 hypothetical protein E5676_scaffold242G00130 [Cucumis melo var. makuwa]